MSNAEQERIRKAVQESIDNNKRRHQRWHWNIGRTACPWGCGDGTGLYVK